MAAPCPSYGFVIRVAFRPALDDAPFWGAFIDFLEERGLYCAGGGGETPAYVVGSDAAQATDADRAAVRSWLASRPEVAEWSVGELFDLDQAV